MSRCPSAVCLPSLSFSPISGGGSASLSGSSSFGPAASLVLSRGYVSNLRLLASTLLGKDQQEGY